MPTCPESGDNFEVADARREYENHFNGDLSYDDISEYGRCGRCSINMAEGDIEAGKEAIDPHYDEDD